MYLTSVQKYKAESDFIFLESKCIVFSKRKFTEILKFTYSNLFWIMPYNCWLELLCRTEMIAEFKECQPKKKKR